MNEQETLNKINQDIDNVLKEIDEKSKPMFIPKTGVFSCEVFGWRVTGHLDCDINIEEINRQDGYNIIDMLQDYYVSMIYEEVEKIFKKEFSEFWDRRAKEQEGL